MKHSTSAQPLLSLCMIVKNEAEYLETCLKLARPHVDEIVVIDTGSTDGSQDIARRYADVFEEIEWPNSFAAARNYSLDRASGKYILILDGDEYIADPQGWQLIRSVLTQRHVATLRLKLRNLLPPGLLEADVIYQERVFPNDPLLRYERKIHNQIVDRIKEYRQLKGGDVIDLPVEIIHFGYAHSEEKTRKKYIPRIPLLEAEYREADNEAMKYYYAFQLGVTFYVLKEYEKALDYFSCIDYEVMNQMNEWNAFYAQLLAAQTALKLRKIDTALQFCDRLVGYKFREAIVYYVTGMALLLKGQIREGLCFLVEAFEMGRNEKEQMRFVINERKVVERIISIFKTIGWNRMAEKIEQLGYTSFEKMGELLKYIQQRMLLAMASSKSEAATPSD
ncbi:glycosyltransferase family 2 protein [Rhodothermus profundi]|uniref:Glycosyltransferase involved in cell wall bisynthesis n=1 Tax=Rhodothermus profundi TaxID=633813 RepID=A0A1M6X896_9BACT|nr:glycosyltransferase family 2 protein [Rhodothermus profundi]SHL02089.1 Glycosyltransferase involved in cell wall bisynthesis [Rhodothermus profundi]